jgi:hypothetical protein
MKVRKEYKIFIRKALLFLLIIIALDFGFGLLARYAYFNQSSGKNYRVTYTMEELNNDVVIFGSSHAANHYVPEIIEEVMGMSCYNAGVQGQRIIFHTTVESIMLKRYKPKLIVLNIDPYWLFENPDSYDALSDLNPYYYKYSEEIAPVLQLKSDYEKYKLLSKLYQYNSTIAHIAKYWLSEQKDYRGYMPLEGQLSAEAVNTNTKSIELESENNSAEIFDPNFIKAVETFIVNARNAGVKLIFVTSPHVNLFDFSDNKSFNKIKEIAALNNVPILDYYVNDQFTGKHEFYKDHSHLNIAGAKYFSKIVAEDLMKLMNKSE